MEHPTRAATRSACPMKKGTLCMIGSCLANRPVEPWSGVCDTCERNTTPRSINNVTASIAAHTWSRIGEHAIADALYRRFDSRGYFAIIAAADQHVTIAPAPTVGVGSVVHWMLGVLGFLVTADCSCMFFVREMNRSGIRWTLRNSPDIVTAMAHEYRKRRPGSCLTDRTLRRGAYTIIYAACAWRFFVSSRLSARGR